MGDAGPSGNGWAEWKRKVLSDLERFGTRQERIVERIAEMCADIAKLKDLRDDVKQLTDVVTELREDITIVKTKLAGYGAAGGAVAGVAVAIITALLLRAFGL